MANPTLSADLIISKGLNTLTTQQANKTIYVSNISSNATIKEVSDFFSFCGNVEKLIQDRDPTSTSGKQFAVVVFEEEGSYSTSLLLGNAIIVDSPIAIYPYINCIPQNVPQASTSDQKTASAVLAGLLAQGYISSGKVLDDMKAKAVEFDGKVNLSNKAKAALGSIKETTGKIDQTIHLSEGVDKLKVVTVTSAKALDEKFLIKENLTELGSKTKEGFQSLAQKSKELSNTIEGKLEANPTLRTVGDGVKRGWSTIVSSISSFNTQVKEETVRRRGGSVYTNPSNGESSEEPAMASTEPSTTQSHDDHFQ